MTASACGCTRRGALMLAENETAAGAAYAVGYESPAQFSRDYRSVFGNPPKRSLRR